MQAPTKEQILEALKSGQRPGNRDDVWTLGKLSRKLIPVLMVLIF